MPPSFWRRYFVTYAQQNHNVLGGYVYYITIELQKSVHKLSFFYQIFLCIMQ